MSGRRAKRIRKLHRTRAACRIAKRQWNTLTVPMKEKFAAMQREALAGKVKA
jgi:hypothetical protein